ncbi:MAG: HAMP domain-containing protein [Candidatus Competibacteraceae bacterium]|nr:HAMP domain-containing protein [Candidatus Competibacteraceae bacterium]
MIIVALIPLGGLWYISSYQASEDWRANINSQLTNTAGGVVNTIDAWVDMNLRVLRQNAALDDISAMIAERQNPILEAIGKAYEWTYLVFTIDPNGQNIGRNDGKPTTSYSDRQYFKDVMSGKPIGQQVLVGRTTGKPALILAAPIPRGGQGQAGVIATASHLVDVSEQVANIRLGKTGFAILLDEAGKAIAHGRPEQLTESLQDMSDHPALQTADSAKQPLVYEQADKRIVAYAQKTSNGWTLIVQQDYAEAFAPLREAERNALILLGASLVIVIIMAFLLSQRLANPIRSLTATADNLSRGKMDESVIGTNRGDEIGALARAIERMGVSIKMAVERLQKAS